ncbi:MAG: hypothetical protein IJ737_03955 [Ruminococcus sp.]|nr:hypothetical protein [Ruminococcus sp.]
MNDTCKICGYRFRSPYETVCPECMTARVEESTQNIPLSARGFDPLVESATENTQLKHVIRGTLEKIDGVAHQPVKRKGISRVFHFLVSAIAVIMSLIIIAFVLLLVFIRDLEGEEEVFLPVQGIEVQADNVY